jgi:hypothetical protein
LKAEGGCYVLGVYGCEVEVACGLVAVCAEFIGRAYETSRNDEGAILTCL